MEGSNVSAENYMLIAFKWGDKIFQRGLKISSKSGLGVHFYRGSKYIATGQKNEFSDCSSQSSIQSQISMKLGML